MLCIEVREVILNVQPQHVMVELCTDRRQRLQAERLDESCSILPGAFGGTSGEKSRKAWFMFSSKHAQIENEEGEIIWL